MQSLQQKINKKQKQFHIALSSENYERLKNLGRAGDSFNDVLNKILFEQQQSPEGGISNINEK